MDKQIRVDFSGSVIVDANSLDDAEQLVADMLNTSLGDLENLEIFSTNDDIYG